MPKPSITHVFSPCVERWETYRNIRKMALKRQTLVKDADGHTLIHPSLPNLRCNYNLLKGYTSVMAEKGFIVTNRINIIKAPINEFYELMEVDTNNEEAKAVVYGTAFVVRQMLTAVKRKWTRWELPRVTGMIQSAIH